MKVIAQIDYAARTKLITATIAQNIKPTMNYTNKQEHSWPYCISHDVRLARTH